MKNLFTLLVLVSFLSFGKSTYSQTKVFTHPDKIIHISPQDSTFAFGKEDGNSSAVSVGRFNNDQYDDLVIGAPFGKNASNQVVSKTYIYHGSSSGVNLLNPTLLNGTFVLLNSQYSKTVGDFNNDGYDDIAVGNAGYYNPSERGYVFIVFSKPNGSGLDTANRINILGYSSVAKFGQDVATGDVNGDGIDDLLVSSPYDQSYVGRIYVYYGGSGFTGSYDKIIYKSAGNMHRLLTNGDVNNDGFDDIIALDDPGWGVSNHRMHIFMGALNMAQQPLETIAAPYLMYSMAGDVNNDGYAEVISSFSNSTHLVIVKGEINFSLNDTVCINNFGSNSKPTEISDINNNGLNDLFINTSNNNETQSCIFAGSASSFINFSDTLFKFKDSDNTYGRSISDLVSADCNSDGHPEFYAYSEMLPYKGVIFVYENTPLNVLPPVVTSGSTCGAGTVTLTAAGATGAAQYKWYASLSSPAVINTGANFTTPILTHDTTFYVAIDSMGSYSTRVAAQAIVHALPAMIGQTGGLPLSLQTGLVAFYPFNGNANDESGHGNNGIVNGATLAQDRCGNANSAYNFNGVNQYIDILNNAVVQNIEANDTISLSMWISVNNCTMFPLIEKINSDTEGWSFYLNCTQLCFYSTPNSNTGTYIIPPNQWAYLTVVHCGNGSTSFYLNGNKVYENISLAHFISTSSNMHIGFSPLGPDEYANGKMDHIRIYNRTLSAQEIGYLYSESCNAISASLSSDTICFGNNTSLTIQNSQTGIAYQLISSGTNYGIPQTGNGNTLIFPIIGLTQTTSFSILATNLITNCSVTLDSTFTVNLYPITNASVSANITICSGSSTTLTASGGSGYLWSNGAITASNTVSPLATTVYYVTVTNGTGCCDTASVTVTVTPALPVSVSLTASATTVCAGDTVQFTAHTINPGSNATLQWFVNGVQVSNSNITNGLIAYYPFNGNALDFSGNNNNAAVVTATPTADRFGNPNSAYNFAGISNPQIIRVPNSPSLHFTNQATFSLWVKMNSYYGMNGWGQTVTNGVHMLFSKDFDQCCLYEAISGMPNGEFYTGGCTNGWYSGINFADTVSGSSIGQWYNLTYVYTPTQGRIFSNGQLIATKTGTTSFANSNSKDLYFGRLNSFWYPLNGKLDEVRFYNRALSDAEVLQLYQGNDSTFSYVPQNGDVVTCVLTVSGTCLTNNPATSNAITMTVTPKLPVSVTLIASANTVCAGDTVNFTAHTINGGANGGLQWFVNGLPASNSLGSGLISYYPLNGNAYDLSGNNHNGSLRGAYGFQSGIKDQALEVTGECGSSNYCTYGNGGHVKLPPINFNNMNSYTLSIWVKENSMLHPHGEGYLFFGNHSTQHVSIAHFGTLQFYAGTQGVSSNYKPEYIDQWVLYSMVVNNGILKAYINDSMVGTNFISPVNLTSDSAAIGKHWWYLESTRFNGSFDDTRIYNRALSAAEIHQLYLGNDSTFYYVPQNGDIVTCVLTASGTCLANNPATSNTITITVNPLPIPVISGVTTVCSGAIGNVYTTEPGMTNYSWSISAGGTITSGTGTNSITVTWNTIGTQTVSVLYTNANACTAATATVYNVVVNPMSAPVLNGSATICASVSGNIYTTQAGMNNYLWSVSPGGTITAGGTPTSNMITITWNSPGVQTVSVNYTNPSGCTAATPGVFNVTVNPVPVPTITGLATVCNGSIGITYTTETGMSAYTWTVSSGGTITAGFGTNSITVTWNSIGAQTVSANYTNANSCLAPLPTIKSVTVNPMAAPTLTGPLSLCQGTIGNIYTTEPGMNSYLWTVSPGGIITAGGTATNNTVTVSWTVPGPQLVSVNYTNVSGCTASGATSTAVTVAPYIVPTISGPNSACQIAGNYTYSTEAGMTGYTWNISTGGIIVGGLGTNSVTVHWITSGNHSLSVNYTNPGGCSPISPTVFNVNIYSKPVPYIAGLGYLCVNSGFNYFYSTEEGMSNYQWTVSPGGTIVSGANTHLLTVTWNLPGDQWVRVNYTNNGGCTASVPSEFGIFVKPLPDAAGTITGVASVCAGALGVSYSVPAIADASSYTWALPSGASLASGNGTNSITVNFSMAAMSGNISVFGTNDCGDGTVSADFPITVNQAPGAAGTISGTSTVCQGQSGVSYSIPAIPLATGYQWSYTGTGVTFGYNITNSVTINFGPNATSGTLSVSGLNSCGIGTASTNYSITINPLPSAAGLIAGESNVCKGQSAVAYSVAAIPLASGYLWSYSGIGATINNGTTNNISVNFAPNATSGNLLVHGVNACGNGVSSALFPISVKLLPVANAGMDKTLANAFSTILSGSATGGSGTYLWHWEPANLLLNADIQNPTTVNLTSTVLFYLTVNDGFGCAGSDEVLVNILSPVTMVTYSSEDTICAGNMTQLYVNPIGGNSSFTFSWTSYPLGFTSNLQNPVVYPEITTSYRVQVDDGFSSTYGYVTVVAKPLPLIPEIPVGQDTIDLRVSQTSTYAITGSQYALTYIWELTPPLAGSISGSGTTGVVEWNLNYRGECFINVKAVNTCGQSISSDAKQVMVVNSTGIIENELITITVYPNPNEGTFAIKCPKAIDKVIIMDVSGKIIDEVTSPDPKHSYKYELAEGVYLIHVEVLGIEFVRKIIVKSSR